MKFEKNILPDLFCAYICFMKKIFSIILISVAALGLIFVFGYKYLYQKETKLPQYPSAQFKTVVRSLERKGYTAGVFTEHSDNNRWRPQIPDDDSQKNKILIDDVSVWSVTVKSKTALAANIFPDVAITEIQFRDEKALQQSKYKIESYSKSLKENKDINEFFQHKNKIYLLQTRALVFVKDFQFVDAFFREEMKKEK